MTIQRCGTKQIEFPTLTFVWTFNRNTGVSKFHLRITKSPDDCHRMEKTLSEEEKQRINALLEKHHPREEIEEEGNFKEGCIITKRNE